MLQIVEQMLNFTSMYITGDLCKDGNILVSRYQNLNINVVGDSMANGAAICAQTSKTNKWSLTPAHDFFTITSRQDTKVLEASPRETIKRRNVLVSSYNGDDSQLWLWDDKNIRSKKIPILFLN